MGVIQKVLNQVFNRLRDINTSQRVALLLGGALVAISLIWLVQWAASPELVPLLEQDLQREELDAIRNELTAMSIEHEIRGSRVYISPSANRTGILARLQQQEKLPANTAIGFAALVKDSDPWISQTENNRRWTYALQEEISAVLGQFQQIRSAKVFLNLNAGRRGFSKHPPRNSASVTLVMDSGGEVPRTLALAAARLVSGAVAGLKVEDVQVVDASGRSALDWDSEHDPSNTLERLRRRHERDYTEKIRHQIPDPHALVNVTVALDHTSRRTNTETPIKGTPVKEDTTSERLSRMHKSDQPGVQPNVGVAAGAGAMDESQERDTTTTEFDTGRKLESEAKPAGDVEQVTAAISLTSSYLEAIVKRTQPDLQQATDEQLQEVFQRERRRLLPQVARLITPQDETNVDIAWHYNQPLTPLAAGPTGTLDQTLDLAKRYGPQSGLGLLALISLGMMLRLAKKGDEGESFGLELGLPKEAIEAAKLAAADVAGIAGAAAARGGRARGGRGGGGGGAGGPIDTEMGTEVEQAAATEGMLVAQEVDASTVQTRKMLDQVGEMVNEDAETVAALVEQWMERNDQYREGLD